MDKTINGGTVSGMGYLEILFNDAINGLDNGSFSKENLLFHRQELVFHCAFDTGHKL